MTGMVSIGVVIPFYDDERRLQWVLNAVAAQTYPLDLVHVVVADDGSPHSPLLPDQPFRLDLVRQADLGFRAAAARNLGADAVDGDLLVFLDGDTVPTPDYLAAMAQAFDDVGPGMLAVGRREHADFTGCTDQDVKRWMRSGVPQDRVIPAPAWLSDGYARTNDLREAGEEDFRFVISAVLAIDRTLFRRAGGFDPTMVGYGGEDWEFAWRCWLLGAQLRHVPDAVGWHDGPDAADREGDRSTARTVKDAESMAVAARITVPSARGRGLVWAQPDIAVSLRGRHGDAHLFLTALSLLRDSDVGIWLIDHDTVPEALAGDPRVHVGAVARSVHDRARFRVEVFAPLRLDRPLSQVCPMSEIDVPGVLRIRSTRRISLGRSGPEPGTAPDWLHELTDDPTNGDGVEQVLGRWNRDE